MKIIHQPGIRTFTLVRKQDVSGVSGVGTVAEGVVFASGKVVISWLTEVTSQTHYDNIEQLTAVHGHGGCTEVVFDLDVPAELIRQQIERISAAAIEADAKRYQFSNEKWREGALCSDHFDGAADVIQSKTTRDFKDALDRQPALHAPTAVGTTYADIKEHAPNAHLNEYDSAEAQAYSVFRAAMAEFGGDPLLVLSALQGYKKALNI